MKIRLLASCLALTMAASGAWAQTKLDWPIGEMQPYLLDSGAQANDRNEPALAFEAAIALEGVTSIRLYFSEVQLEPGSFVRMTSMFDGEEQELDAAGLAMWGNTSAYFNGDTVQVELHAGPGTKGNRIVVDQVWTYVPAHEAERGGPCAGDNCGMCGADDRVPSNEFWSGRLMPVGCSATVYNASSCVVSAGHCAGGSLTIQFNTPNSSAGCNPQNPPIADQFPITGQQYNNGGVGNDWSVMTTGTNNLGQKPYQRYGIYMPLSGSPANVGQSCAVWGYGVDNTNPTSSQDQQTSSGTIGFRSSTYYEYSVDVTYGNSGSGLIEGGELVGIVTHCSFDCSNIATRHDIAAFVAARDNLCGTDITPPSPNPLTWGLTPTGTSSSTVVMTANTASDEQSPPVEYYFDFVSGGAGGADSGWQSSASYANFGLSPNTSYSYRCQARDSAVPPNTGSYSTIITAVTYAVVPGAPTVGGITDTSMTVNVDPATNPAATQFAIQCASTTDAAWNGMYVSTTGTPSATAIWQTDSTWGAKTVLGLIEGTEYCWRVKARNSNNVETAFGAQACATTTGGGPACTGNEVLIVTCKLRTNGNYNYVVKVKRATPGEVLTVRRDGNPGTDTLTTVIGANGVGKAKFNNLPAGTYFFEVLECPVSGYGTCP